MAGPLRGKGRLLRRRKTFGLKKMYCPGFPGIEISISKFYIKFCCRLAKSLSFNLFVEIYAHKYVTFRPKNKGKEKKFKICFKLFKKKQKKNRRPLSSRGGGVNYLPKVPASFLLFYLSFSPS